MAMPSRPRAVIVHFLGSLLVVSTVLALVYFVWYPHPYFQIIGPANVLRTLVAVDLVLGPLLTAVVYKPNKKGLWFDMTVIFLVQLSALVYGTSVLYQERPQFMIFAVDRFVVLPQTDLYPNADVPRPVCDGQGLPCIAAARIPEDSEARDELLFRIIEEGIEIEQQPRYWQPLADALPQLQAALKPLDLLRGVSVDTAEALDRMISNQDVEGASLGFLPVINKRLQAMSLIIDRRDGALIDVVAVDPWTDIATDQTTSEQQLERQ